MVLHYVNHTSTLMYIKLYFIVETYLILLCFIIMKK